MMLFHTLAIMYLYSSITVGHISLENMSNLLYFTRENDDNRPSIPCLTHSVYALVMTSQISQCIVGFNNCYAGTWNVIPTTLVFSRWYSWPALAMSILSTHVRVSLSFLANHSFAAGALAALVSESYQQPWHGLYGINGFLITSRKTNRWIKD